MTARIPLGVAYILLKKQMKNCDKYNSGKIRGIIRKPNKGIYVRRRCKDKLLYGGKVYLKR